MSKIVEIKCFPLSAAGRAVTVVRVRTDDGYEGLGEAAGNYRVRACLGAIEDFAMYLLGKDPSQIERHWQALYRNSFFRGGFVQCTALSALEMALWDIQGKVLNRPVWALLGGACRDRIRVYSHALAPTTEAVVDGAIHLVEKGHRALKLAIPDPVEPVLDLRTLRRIVAQVQAVREAVGSEIDLILDCHGKLTPSLAIRLAEELIPYNLLFLEEPLPPENVDALAMVARATKIPLATGERLFTRWGFREVLEKQAVAVLQPDLGHAGGILEAKKIAALGETYYTALAPHNPRGPVITMASLQVATCTPNFLIQEMLPGDPLRAEMMVQPLEVDDGYVPLPTAPGLGIRFDEALADRFPFTPRDTPHPVLRDGSVADW